MRFKPLTVALLLAHFVVSAALAEKTVKMEVLVGDTNRLTVSRVRMDMAGIAAQLAPYQAPDLSGYIAFDSGEETLTLSNTVGTVQVVSPDANSGMTVSDGEVNIFSGTDPLTLTGAVRINGGTCPTTAVDPCAALQVCLDAAYIYVCIATDTWQRVAIATW